MTEEAVINGASFKPPWMAFQTLWSFTQELSEHDLPPVIDRSLMASKSGTDQANLLAALKSFGLIDESNRVQPALAEIASSDPEIRKLALGELVAKYYAGPLEVSSANGTQAQLVDRFREEYGIAGADTLRKATTFFLQACRTAEIPVSPYFKSTRASSGGGGSKTRKARKSKANGAETPDTSPPPPPTPDEHRVSVALVTGGTMTLSVSVNPLSLRGEDRSFFYDIVDKLMDYQEKSAHKGSRPSAIEEAE